MFMEKKENMRKQYYLIHQSPQSLAIHTWSPEITAFSPKMKYNFMYIHEYKNIY